VTELTTARRIFQREAACIQGSDNSLYCTNRMSLRTHSMLKSPVYIYKSHGSYWNIIEDSRRLWKAVEGNGKLWNLMEVSRKHKNIP